MNMEHMQAELNNVLNTISNSSSRGRSATTRRADQKKHVKSGKGKVRCEAFYEISHSVST